MFLAVTGTACSNNIRNSIRSLVDDSYNMFAGQFATFPAIGAALFLRCFNLLKLGICEVINRNASFSSLSPLLKSSNFFRIILSPYLVLSIRLFRIFSTTSNCRCSFCLWMRSIVFSPLCSRSFWVRCAPSSYPFPPLLEIIAAPFSLNCSRFFKISSGPSLVACLRLFRISIIPNSFHFTLTREAGASMPILVGFVFSKLIKSFEYCAFRTDFFLQSIQGSLLAEATKWKPGSQIGKYLRLTKGSDPLPSYPYSMTYRYTKI